MNKVIPGSGRLIGAGALLLLLVPARAWADSSSGQVAAADVIFADAKKLAAAGRFNDACPKFEESQRLDPTPGTLLNLGDCYKQASPPRTASAWGAYQQAGMLARSRGDTARQDAARERAQTIEPVLSRVTISPAPAARIAGLDVKWDGTSVGVGTWDTAIPVDAGEHAIEASAPGKTSWTGKVVVRLNGGLMTVEVPALVDAPASVGADVEAPERPSSGTQRAIGVSVAAAGVVGIVVGSIYGVKTGNTNAEALRHCQPGESNLCDAQGVALGEDAFASATVSTTAFIVGGAALAGGAILFFTAPPGQSQRKTALVPRRLEARPLVGWGFGGLTLRGEW
jgi:serine/threonine-protein kinase